MLVSAPSCGLRSGALACRERPLRQPDITCWAEVSAKMLLCALRHVDQQLLLKHAFGIKLCGLLQGGSSMDDNAIDVEDIGSQSYDPFADTNTPANAEHENQMAKWLSAGTVNS